MPLGTIIIRADAGTALGSGHTMRCAALAQAWQDGGGRAVFVIGESTPAVNQFLDSEGFDVIRLGEPIGGDRDSARLIEIAQERDAAWVILDGLHLGKPINGRSSR